jgi:hypothetical protein
MAAETQTSALTTSKRVTLVNQTLRSQLAVLMMLGGGALMFLAPGGLLWHGPTVSIRYAGSGPINSKYSTNPGIGAGPKVGAVLFVLGAASAAITHLNRPLRSKAQ